MQLTPKYVHTRANRRNCVQPLTVHVLTSATDQLRDLLSYNVNVTTWGEHDGGMEGLME